MPLTCSGVRSYQRNHGVAFARTRSASSRTRVGGLAACELLAGGLIALEEVLLPESPAAEYAAGPASIAISHLLLVAWKSTPARSSTHGRSQAAFERLEVVHQLVVGVSPELAGKLGLVDVAVAAEMAGALDDRLGLAIEVALAVLLFAAEGEGDRLQQQQNVVLLAFLVDLLDEGELMLGAVRLGRLELGQQLDGVGAHAFDLVQRPSPARSRPGGRRRRSCWRADFSTRTSMPTLRGRCEAGHRVPGAVVAIDENGAGVLARGRRRGRSWPRPSRRRSASRFFALLFEAVLNHADHGVVLIGGDHGQGAVVVADALQAAQLAGGQAQAEQSGHAGGHG